MEHVKKVGKTKFAHGLNMKYERKKGNQDDSKVYGLRNWNNGATID